MYFQGIAGLDGNGNQPWGAVITIGEKGPSGAPTNTDRFFIKKPQAETAEFRGRSALVRRNHPDFEKFNRLDDVRWRQTRRMMSMCLRTLLVRIGCVSSVRVRLHRASHLLDLVSSFVGQTVRVCQRR